MRKIVFINCTDIGSTGKIIQCIAQYTAEKGIENLLFVPRVSAPATSETMRVYAVSSKNRQRIIYRLSKVNGNRYGFSYYSTRKLIRMLRKEKPDLVHVHCANGNFLNLYRLFAFLGSNEICTVITNHAEFYYTGNCDHAFYCDRWKSGCGSCPSKFSLIDGTAHWWKQMKKSIQSIRYLTVTSVSGWVYSRSMQSPIMEGIRQVVVENAVNTEVFKRYLENDITERYPAFRTEKKILFHVTAFFYGNSEKKGSKYVLQLARRLKPLNVTVIVAGSYALGMEVPENVILLGRVEDQADLAKMYAIASLSLITSERETFSMPVAESLCCGTPIVGFRAGGPESIALSEYTEFVEFGDTPTLEQTVMRWIDFKTEETAQRISQEALKKYSEKRMAMEYTTIYHELIGQKENGV